MTVRPTVSRGARSGTVYNGDTGGIEMPDQPAPPAHSLTHLIAVRPESSGQFTAEAGGLPDLRATAATREEAIEQVRALLRDHLSSGRLVAVDVSADVPATSPLMHWFGHAKDDPEFDVYLEEIRKYREQEDERFRRETER